VLVANRCGKRRRRFEPVQPFEHHKSFVRRRAAVDRRIQQTPRLVALAAPKRVDAVLQQFLRLALTLRHRAARTLDIGARPRMTPIEKQRTGPDVDRLLILRGKVVVEADEEQLLDLRIAIGFQRTIVRVGWIAS